MTLSPASYAYAQQQIKRHERAARQWPWARWVVLTVCLVIMCVAGYAYHSLSARLAAAHAQSAMWKAGTPITQGDLDTRLEYQVWLLRTETTWQLNCVLILITYGLGATMTLVLWNRQRYHALMAELLRQCTPAPGSAAPLAPPSPPAGERVC